jgi:purine-binding chemotaxis protein CheW
MSEEESGTRDLEESQIVVFELGKERYGVNIHTIREIIRYSEVTQVPETPAYVDGVLNIRGTITTIVSLRDILGLPRIERNEKTRVLIMDLHDSNIGVVVDSVSEVLRMDSSRILEAGDIGSADQMENIKGMVEINGSLIILFDLLNLLKGLNLRE